MINCIITIYKEPIYQIKRAINSILNQTMSNFKLIIVLDNKEYNEAINLVREYEKKDDRINFIINEKNLKSAGARNVGISYIEEGYYVMLDADDEAYPNRFEVCYNFMEAHPDVDVGFVGAQSVLEADHSKFFDVYPTQTDDIAKVIKRYCPCHVQIFRYSSLQKYGPYVTKYSRAEDYHTILNWYVQGAKFAPINQIVQKNYFQDNFAKKSVKSILQTMQIKLQYGEELNLKLSDYLYFIYDLIVIVLLIILPSRLYFDLFILRNKK